MKIAILWNKAAARQIKQLRKEILNLKNGTEMTNKMPVVGQSYKKKDNSAASAFVQRTSSEIANHRLEKALKTEVVR